MKSNDFIESLLIKRILICICFAVFSFYIIQSVINHNFFWVYINLAGIIFSILLFIFPRNLCYLAFLGFYYGCIVLIFFPEEHAAIAFFAVGILAFCIQGFYHNHKLIKILITILLYFACIATEIRFGLPAFRQMLIKKMIYSAVFVIIFFLIYAYVSQLMELHPKKTLDLCSANLTDEELIIFYLLSNNYKFDYISRKLNISNSTIKRRCREIYNYLGVQDIICFHGKIGRMNIIYPEHIKREIKNLNL
ncbi:MAG: hypothetical protein K6E97_06380 [Treponema sp.]|jgi:hypothetical protein|nr:hypothetical protein [Treponema sp.]